MRFSPVRPTQLSPLSVAWRVCAVVVCAGLLLYGHLTRSELLFPFGILSQFSGAVDPNSTVSQACAYGEWADGESHPIELDYSTVGVKRSEVENALAQFRDDPQRLAGLAMTYRRTYPEHDLRAFTLCLEERPLRQGAPTGEVRIVPVATWRMDPPAASDGGTQ